MAKFKNLKVAERNDEKKKEDLFIMVNMGEEISTKLMEMLSEYGSSPEALLAETYALSKAWAALKVVAEDKGFYPDDLFNKLLPGFIDEMKDALKDGHEE